MIRTSDTIDEIASALSTAQGQMQNPKKNKKVRVPTKSGRTYEFSYADLTACIDAIKGPLAANGLSYIQAMAEDPASQKFRLVTRLMHSSGQWLESTTPLFVEEGNSQAFGSALTFMKRYALGAMLGFAADDDDDANVGDGTGGGYSDTREYGTHKPKPPASSPMEAAVAPQAAPLEALKPHAIPVPTSEEHGGHDWPAWGRTFIDRARAAPTQNAQDAWLVVNQDNLAKMLVEAPKVFTRLEKATADIFPKILLDDPDEGVVIEGVVR